MRSNILFLGVDQAPEGTSLGRTDTIILSTMIPLRPTIRAVSIPRDLWVNIPGHGEGRINSAHFFGENAQTGMGPQLAMQTVEMNFGVEVHHYVRVHEGFQAFIDSLGGIEIALEESIGGYPPGRHHLNGEAALAFMRDRDGTNDFFRMRQGQIVLRSLMTHIAAPQSWVHLPQAFLALERVVGTDIPLGKLPMVGLAL